MINVLTPVAALGSAAVLLTGSAQAAISLGGTHTENFDTFLNTGSTGGGSIPIDAEIGAAFFSGTVSPGWWNGANTSFGTATSGAQANSNRLLSFGVDSVAERALGLGRNGQHSIGAQFQNDTGASITQLDIRYDGETWYKGAAASTGFLDFEYSTNATSVLDGAATWTSVTALDYNPNPVAGGQFSVRDGNDAANRATISSSITGLSIADTDTFFIRWSMQSNGHGLGIDNFSITPIPEPASLALLGLGSCAVLTGRRRRA